jgi:hypothetical protein
MSKSKGAHTREVDAKAAEALITAQNMPPGPERNEALDKADRLRRSAQIYNYVFSDELKPPE